MSGKVVLTVGAVLRGDDAAGPMLSKMMEENPIEGWETIDGGQMPEDFIAPIRRAAPDVLMVVDAADMGLNPGEIRILDEQDVATDCLITTHSLPISFLLEQLKESCGNVVFLGIQPAQTEFFGSLTPEVHAAVERIYGFLAKGASFGESVASLEEDEGNGNKTGDDVEGDAATGE